MTREAQEREDHILDCYAVIKEKDAEIERLHLVIASAERFLVERGYTVQAAELRRAMEPKP